MNTKKLKKIIIKALPYVLMGLVCTNLGEAWRLAEGADASKKLLSFFSTLGTRRSVLCGLYPPQKRQALQTQSGIRFRPMGYSR